MTDLLYQAVQENTVFWILLDENSLNLSSSRACMFCRHSCHFALYLHDIQKRALCESLDKIMVQGKRVHSFTANSPTLSYITLDVLLDGHHCGNNMNALLETQESCQKVTDTKIPIFSTFSCPFTPKITYNVLSDRNF